MLSTDADSCDVEIHTSESGFHSLLEEWNELAGQHSPSSVFLTHQWFDAAWQWRKLDSSMQILTVRSKGSIVAIAPFVITVTTLSGVQLRCLEFLSVPDTQECDILCRSGYEQSAAASIARYLRHSADWDIARLGKLLPDTFCTSYLPAALTRCSIRHINTPESEVNLTMPMADDWATYYSRRSRRLKKGNNLISNRINKSFDQVEVQWLHGKNIGKEELQAALDDIIRISSNSWKGDCTQTTFDNSGPEAFINRLIEKAAGEGWLSVWRLVLDSQCVATELQLIHNGIIAALRADFDNQLKKHSPGTYLNWKLLERLFDESSLTEYRMGPGRNEYKMRWAETTLVLSGITAYGTSLKARYVYFMEEIARPAVRQLKNRPGNQDESN